MTSEAIPWVHRDEGTVSTQGIGPGRQSGLEYVVKGSVEHC